MSAIQASSDGTRLYIALRHRVAVFGAASTTLEEFIEVPDAGAITSVGSPGVSPDLTNIRCAC